MRIISLIEIFVVSKDETEKIKKMKSKRERKK